MTSIPTRFDGDLFAAAKSSGEVSSRSAAQQLAHWARIGREFESDPSVNLRDVEAVLAGGGSYDVLREREQAIVRAEWDERLKTSLATANLENRFRAAGQPYAEADAEGNVVMHEPTRR